MISRLVASWLGWLAIGAGLVSAAIGIDVAYSGLESGFQDAASLVFVVAVLVFAIGLIITGRRGEPLAIGAGQRAAVHKASKPAWKAGLPIIVDLRLA